MRGVVTLAAAFVIPVGTEFREILLLVAFTVVAGTLFIQGLTLPLLAKRLKVPSPDPMDDALARATLLQQASKAGYKALDALDYEDPHGVEALVRQRVDQRNFSAWERLGTTADQETPSELYARVRLTMINAERERILEIRSTGTVPSDVVGEVLAMLDVEESMIDVASEARRDIRAADERRSHPGAGCEEPGRFPVADIVSDGTCRECIRDGTEWVALRQCLGCGHVGCCDSSPRQHATTHFHDTAHPVIQSAEPGESWRWCYIHHVTA
jgi:CPA1 family monovalent cation:H+ antiporter